jgi:hypothetical protein
MQVTSIRKSTSVKYTGISDAAWEWPKLGRLLVVLLITLDTFRRMLFHDARPIDTAMLIVEILVLALILADFIWHVAVWYRKRREMKQQERIIDQSLGALDDSLADIVRDHILQDRRPSREVATQLYGTSEISLVEPDGRAWKFSAECKPAMRKWAKRRLKRRP